MVLITCKKCGDVSYLTSEGLGNLTDFGFKCRNCDTINRISLADGELKKQEYSENRLTNAITIARRELKTRIICVFWLYFMKIM
jgi:hypothetical protein